MADARVKAEEVKEPRRVVIVGKGDTKEGMLKESGLPDTQDFRSLRRELNGTLHVQW